MPALVVRPSPIGGRSAPWLLDWPLPPVDDLTRRELLKGAAALLVATACGGDGDTEAASPTTAVGGFPITIEHKYGSTHIPAAPERVVSVGFGEQDFVLALGVTPIGVREWLGPYPFDMRPWAPDQPGEGEPKIVGAEELDFERIATLAPDLIVGVYSLMTADEYALLSQIAPTLAQTGEFPDGGVPWQEQLRVTGRGLGREERAEQLVAEVESQFAQAREEHPEFEGRTAAVDMAQDGHYILESQDRRMRFFTSLGFKTPDETGPISPERTGLLDQDVLVVFAKREEVEGVPLFQGLDAVAEGRVIYIPLAQDLAGAIGVGSPLSLPFALEQAVPLLAAAVDRDRPSEVSS